MRNILSTLLIVLVSVSSAAAQTLNECDWVASVGNVWEPLEDYTRTFANGNIRVIPLDTGGEPVCCSRHLAILSPHPEWGRSCTVLSWLPQTGWYDVHFDRITASYDPALGLLLNVPVGFYNPETGAADPSLDEVVHVRINQATGSVELE